MKTTPVHNFARKVKRMAIAFVPCFWLPALYFGSFLNLYPFRPYSMQIPFAISSFLRFLIKRCNFNRFFSLLVSFNGPQLTFISEWTIKFKRRRKLHTNRHPHTHVLAYGNRLASIYEANWLLSLRRSVNIKWIFNEV